LNLFGALVLAVLETAFFPSSESELETAVCGLVGPVKPSAGCWLPVLERFPRSTTKLPKAFTGLLVPIPLVKVTFATSFAFPGRACWARNFIIFLRFRK
jgi:hypothetical protein